jgi:DNA invertase Pin-like site-specific DNA recombinase
MVVGYVRLSRDDDKKNYVSIENQKLIINQYAANIDIVIDRWYEDDGFSGYSFNRPGFKQLLSDLDKDVDLVIAKDLSRIGRHNARVLLLLDDFKERDKRLIIIDDDYDSIDDEDDIIGIKTWYNERYVKDASKKIKRVIRARQKEGTLMLGVPFGYNRNKVDKSIIEIEEKEAVLVRKIFDLYLQGNGYRKISSILNMEETPTPSMILKQRRLEQGKSCNRRISTIWSDGMISDILKNDFYIGNLRLHKRARGLINGADKRVAKKDQILFENNHKSIIDKNTFELVQDIMSKRVRTNYRGQSSEGNIFGGCLFCSDCGSRLTPIIRSKDTNRKYYICNTYNSKGKRFCEHAHIIKEKVLLNDLVSYIKLCRNSLIEVIETYDINDYKVERESIDEKRKNIISSIDSNKKQLKILLSQKVKDLTLMPGNDELINETYSLLISDVLSKINEMELQLNTIKESGVVNSNVQKKLETALEVIDNIINKDCIDRKDVEILVEKIIVDQEGMPSIELKYGLSGLVKYNPAEELNKQENNIILSAMKLIYEEERTYTSAKYISAKLTEMGYKKSKRSVLPYIAIMIDKSILKPTENSLKPYDIIVSKDVLINMINNYIDTMSNWWYAGNGV